ncbi:MAG: hypothetical protein IJ196_03620 [Prevotella sp.]|nr:hypothetical protein [Prevotella sp.]
MKKLIAYSVALVSMLACCNNDSMLEITSLPQPHYSNSVKMSGKYGVKWQTNNPYDLGHRCFDAEGLNAHFGVGNIAAVSDFDEIYPWSDIRRCNIRRENDQTFVTYEGQPGFALDGSNGDVFVRIPKFSVEKYESDGYEYRVISANGSKPHPAFIENGQELDAVYVSAFEGYIDDNGLLRSIANVIPTSNIAAQQFLDAAQKRGAQYTLYDMRTVDLLFSLFAVEYGCRNSSVIFGHGVSDYRQPIEKEWDPGLIYYSKKNEQHTNSITCRRQEKTMITVGSNICICNGNQRNILTFARLTSIMQFYDTTIYTFDGPPVDITTDCFIGSCAQSTNWTETCRSPHTSHSGRANMLEAGFLPEERNPMRYRWMENIVGNVWHFLPDIAFKNLQMYVCSDMNDYCFATYESPYQPYGHPLIEQPDNSILSDGAGTNYWVTTLFNDEDNKGITFGCDFSKSLNSQEAFGAYYYLKDGAYIVANGGGFDHQYRCNLLTTRAWIEPDYRWHLYGARLLFKDLPDPVATIKE